MTLMNIRLFTARSVLSALAAAVLAAAGLALLGAPGVLAALAGWLAAVIGWALALITQHGQLNPPPLRPGRGQRRLAPLTLATNLTLVFPALALSSTAPDGGFVFVGPVVLLAAGAMYLLGGIGWTLHYLADDEAGQ